MRKILICIAAISALTVAGSSAAFRDISDAELQRTAVALQSLGIMNGTGNDRFDPDAYLTRAQFCKLAVTAMGCRDVDAFSGYTIFPDVRGGSWYAPYVNAAIRHPSIKDRAIIHGHGDGTFGPNNNVSYGEACTMLLRMLGYQEADIGPFWPADYIAKADALHLTDGVSLTDAATNITRAQAATLFLNTLTASPKEGDATLLAASSSSVQENMILLATADTNRLVRSGQGLFFDGATLSLKPIESSVDQSMVGIYGTAVFDKDDPSVVSGILPNKRKTEQFTVQSVSPDSISVAGKIIRPDRSTALYTGAVEEIKSFAETWADIQVNDTLQLFYDENGILLLMAAMSPVNATSDNTIVYGVSSTGIPSTFTIVKNGVIIDAKKLNKYDVITFDSANKQAIVSDAKLSGPYSDASPNMTSPQSVTLYDTPFRITDQLSTQFANFSFGNYITLLFDINHNVVAAYPQSEIMGDRIGVLKTTAQGSQIELLNGITITPKLSKDEMTALSGCMVNFSATKEGTVRVSKKELLSKANGNWLPQSGLIGTTRVSPTVKVFESVLENAPIAQIDKTTITQPTVSANNIRFTVQDSAGTVTAIVMDDVTGNGWLYGNAYVGVEKELMESESGTDDQDNYKQYPYISLLQSDGNYQKYYVDSIKSLSATEPIAIPKGYSVNLKGQKIEAITLSSLGAANVSDFDADYRVRIGGSYHLLDKDLSVYVPKQKKMISLSQAKLDYKKLKVYVNPHAVDDETIRAIVAVE